MPDFLPRREQDLVNWLRNFADRIVVDPQRYYIPTLEADAYRARVQEYAQVYANSQNAGMRTPAGLMAKDALRKEVADTTRSLTMRIRGTSDVTPTELILLGLRPRKKKVGRLPTPTTVPIIRLAATSGRQIAVRLSDSEVPSRLGKPRHVRGATLWMHVDAREDEDEPFRWQVVGRFTRMRFTVTLDGPLSFGQTVWLIACWNSPTGKHGPFSQPAKTRIVEEMQSPARSLSAA